MKLYMIFSSTSLGLLALLSAVSAQQQLRSPTAHSSSSSEETSHLRIHGHVDGGMRGLRTNHDHGRNLLPSPFSQCPTPEAGTGLPGFCYTFPDPTGSNNDLVNYVSDEDGTDGQTQAMTSDVLEPIQSIINIILSTDFQQNGIDPFQICIGDFDGSVIVENAGATPLCKTMPLKKEAKWSVFAFSLTIPPGQSQAICKTADPAKVKLEACLAVSNCEGIPSVAFAVGGGMIGCVAGQGGAPTVGLASVAGSAVKLALGSVSTGFSPTNAFEMQIMLYNGRNLIKYTNTPTFFDQIQIAINATKIDPRLKNFFSLTATQTRGITIMANPDFDGSIEDTVESILASFDGNVEGADVLDGFVDVLEDLGISIEIVSEATLTGTFDVKKIPVIGPIFPKLSFEAFEANTYMFLGTGAKEVVVDKDTGKTETVYPGISLFAGTSVAATFIKSFVDFIGKAVGSVLDLLPSWCPVDLDLADILSEINLGAVTEDDAFGAGATFNTDRTGFLINVPIVIDEIGQVKVNCYTDYTKFNCEVEANADGLLSFFTGVVGDVAEGALWVARLTDETFQEVGPVVAAAFIDVGSEIENVFSPESLKNTGRLLADGALDLVGSSILSLDEAAVVGAVMNTFLNPEEVLGPLIGEGVKEIAEWGEGLVNVAGDAYDGAKGVVDGALDVAGNAFGCAGSLVYSGGSLSSSCSDFSDLGQALEDVGGKIGDALEKAWDEVSDFFEDVADFFWGTRTSYEYRFKEPAEYGKYNCRVMNIRKVTRNKVGPFTVKTRRRTVGQTVEEACVRSRLQQISAINFDVNRANQAFQQFMAVQNENLDALAGVTYSTDPTTFVCTTRWVRNDGTDAGVPLEVTCTTPQILGDGTISTETLSATKSLRIRMDTESYGSIPTVIETLTSQTRLALVDIITSSMTRQPSFCEPTPGPAGDGVDNDCNGLVDDSILCDYEDHIPGDVTQFSKDCKCAPPILAPIADVTVACNAEYTTTAIGTPAVTLSSSGDTGCPATGSFMGELDTTDYLNTCGDAVITRIHQYADGLTQTSNTVSQTVTLTKVPPVLDESLVEEVIFVDSTVEVKEGMGETSFLAPDAEVPEELGVSVCASVLDEYFQDLSIDYVGCPENPEDIPNGKYKGWNVERQWIVEDECGQQDTYTQTVVRTDEVAPTLDMPLVRVQSCRASYEPINTGYPIASDQSDPSDVLNPSDWSVLPLADGRISYSDSGDFQGCEQDFVREFVVNDRVCNEFSDSHVVQSSPFDFRPTTESTTEYDPSSLLPTFEYDLAGAPRQVYEDVVKYNFGVDEDTYVDGCLETYVEWLDTTRQDAVWSIVGQDFANGVFKVDDGFKFTIQINEDRRPVYEDIINASLGGVGVFRMSLSCFSENTPPERRLKQNGNGKGPQNGNGNGPQNGNGNGPQNGNGKGPRDLVGHIMFKLKLK